MRFQKGLPGLTHGLAVYWTYPWEMIDLNL
jgi:hypothetical protein